MRGPHYRSTIFVADPTFFNIAVSLCRGPHFLTCADPTFFQHCNFLMSRTPLFFNIGVSLCRGPHFSATKIVGKLSETIFQQTYRATIFVADPTFFNIGFSLCRGPHYCATKFVGKNFPTIFRQTYRATKIVADPTFFQHCSFPMSRTPLFDMRGPHFLTRADPTFFQHWSFLMSRTPLSLILIR